MPTLGPAAIFAILVLLLIPTADAVEPAPRFELPVRCEIGNPCIVQNYVAHDPGPGAQDHTCGPLTYDGHKGVDIRVPSLVEMRDGVPVIAAAPGTVKGRRDGMPDISVRKAGAKAVTGREAGNGVVIDHGGGWESQYSHLLKGSVTVRPGDRVETGQVLGMIGLSGFTEFPHVHFSVRLDGKTLDPFTGRPPGSGCGGAVETLWSERALERLTYRAGGLLLAGFASGKPDREGVLNGRYQERSLPAAAPALVFWALTWGLRGGDEETLIIDGPNDRRLVDLRQSIPKDKAQWFRFGGKRRPPGGWPRGRYEASYRVRRIQDGAKVDVVNIVRSIDVR